MTYASKVRFLSEHERRNLRMETDRLILKALAAGDITQEYISGLNDPGVNHYLLEVKQRWQTYESVKSFVEENIRSSSNILFGIFLKSSPPHLIGTVRLTAISLFHYSSGIGICIFSKPHWRKGYALEALLKVKEFIFDTMGMHYIEAGMYSENKPSVKLFQRAGFECYVRIPDKYRLGDRFVDVSMFKAVNPDFNHKSLEE